MFGEKQNTVHYLSVKYDITVESHGQLICFISCMKEIKGRGVLRMVSPHPPFTSTMWDNGTRNNNTREVL